ncbi:MAG: prepilin-type N-terminal cleavage/methylation domain-containing protein [Armatimonadota bacterium]
MHTTFTKRGFTLIELLVVIAIIAVLASILFPVFAKAKAKAHAVSCLSNIRQLSMATLMFAQDNRQTFPDADTWAADIEDSVGNRKIFACPSDENGDGYISYGLSCLLVHPDGKGLKTDAVKNPVEVAMFFDATSKQFPDGGIVPSGNATNIQDLERRHNNGLNMAFVDGHAESLGGKKNFDLDEMDSPLARALYYPVAFGWVNNPGAGITPPSSPETNGIVKVGGSTTTMDLMKAGVDAWNAGGGFAENGTYHGSAGWGVDVGTTLWADTLYGQEGDTVLGASSNKGGDNQTIIARDGLVLIVNKNCKIPASFFEAKETTSKAKAQAIWGSETLDSIYTTDPTSVDKIHIYTRKITEAGGGAVVSGTYEYFSKTVLGGANGKLEFVDYNKFTQVWTNAEMVAAVSRDPYAIGYTGAGEVDPELVTILKWKRASDGEVETYSRKGVLAGGWELTRPLYASYETGNLAATAFVAFLQTTTFQNSPIMKSLYFPPATP